MDNGLDITHYIRLTRTPDGQCIGILQVLSNEDGLPPATIFVVRPNASEVLNHFKNMMEVAQ